MKKRWIMLLLAMLLVGLCTAASADTLDILKPMWLNALESSLEQKAQESAAPAEPKVISGDEALEVVRYAVYTDDEYSTEAYVYAELRNIGESVLRLNGAALNIYDASGRQTGREEYASVKPDVVMPGESLFVTEWLYDFVSSLDKAASIEVTVERSEYSRKRIETLPQARAYIEDDYLYAEVTNTTDAPLFDVSVIAVACDANGRMLDMLMDETYSSIGIAPDSTMVFREALERHAIDFPGAVCEAQGYRYEE